LITRTVGPLLSLDASTKSIAFTRSKNGALAVRVEDLYRHDGAAEGEARQAEAVVRGLGDGGSTCVPW